MGTARYYVVTTWESRSNTRVQTMQLKDRRVWKLVAQDKQGQRSCECPVEIWTRGVMMEKLWFLTICSSLFELMVFNRISISKETPKKYRAKGIVLHRKTTIQVDYLPCPKLTKVGKCHMTLRNTQSTERNSKTTKRGTHELEFKTWEWKLCLTAETSKTASECSPMSLNPGLLVVCSRKQ